MNLTDMEINMGLTVDVDSGRLILDEIEVLSVDYELSTNIVGFTMVDKGEYPITAREDLADYILEISNDVFNISLPLNVLRTFCIL